MIIQDLQNNHSSVIRGKESAQKLVKSHHVSIVSSAYKNILIWRTNPLTLASHKAMIWRPLLFALIQICKSLNNRRNRRRSGILMEGATGDHNFKRVDDVKLITVLVMPCAERNQWTCFLDYLANFPQCSKTESSHLNAVIIIMLGIRLCA